MDQTNNFLIKGKEKYEQKRAQRIEKQRSNLLKNKLSFEQKKNKELSQRCDYLEEELEKSQNENFFNGVDQDEILQMSLQINSYSSISYSLLASKLPFPPKSRVDKITHEITNKIPSQLRNLGNLSNIIDIWKENNRIPKSLTIHACLAVDAIYFTPNVEISKDSVINGMIFSKDDEILISKNIFKTFYEKPKEFQNFLSLNANKIIKAAFVFQVQPYNPIYNNFIIHIKAACNGKANDDIVFTLNYIKDHLKNRNITVLTFAFDGDSAYSNLHNEYFNSYITFIIKHNLISFTKSLKFKVTTDFLHLIKRLRYRLFGVKIFSGFTISEYFFDVEILQQIFPNFSAIIWSNELITKMHDSLPLILFNPTNFVYLLENKHFVEAEYWMPISLSILAFDGNGLGYSNRMYLLQIAFYFLVYYYEQKINTKKIELFETKKGGKNLQFYSTRILIEFLNTLHSNIQLMEKLEKFSFPRNSTGPLEHKFGCCRKRSKFIHTLNKFCQVVSFMQCVEQKSIFEKCANYEIELEKIQSRVHSFGVIVEGKNDEKELLSTQMTKETVFQDKLFSPQQIARSMMYFAGFSTTEPSLASADDAIDYLITFVSEFLDENTPIKRKKVITHKSFTYGVGQCANGKLLTTSSAKTLQIKIAKIETKKLLDDKIREKFDYEDDINLTKSDYYSFIKLIKNYADNKITTPDNKCTKGEMINWLLDHFGSFISIISEL